MAANNGSTSNSCPNDELLIPKEEKEDSTINNSNFTMESIPSTSFQGQDFELRDICGVSVYNQTELEEGLLKQVDEQEKQRQAESAKIELGSVQIDIRSVKQRLRHIDQALAMPSQDSTTWTKATKRQVESIKREKENKEKQMKKLLAKQKSLLLRIDGNLSDTLELDDDEEMDPESRYQLENIFGLRQKETNEEKLIRTGHMTPFGTVIGAKKAPSIVQSSGLTDFEKYLLSQEDLGKKKVKKRVEETQVTTKSKKEKEKTVSKSPPSLSSIIEKTKKKRKKKEQLGTVLQGDKVLRGKKNYQWKEEEQVIDLDQFNGKHLSDSDYVPSSDENTEDKSNKKSKLFSKKRKRSSTSDESDENDEKSKSSSSRTKRYVDDGNQEDYLKRIKKWQRERLKIKHSLILEDKNPDDLIEEFQDLGDGFKVPTLLWNKLYKYQQTCVQWLWELHCQQCGGIIGDEMGLGKTIQVIAFLAALWFSKVLTRGDKVRGLGSVLIVTPTTVMLQWVKEFHQWWPPFRVAILHESGSYTGTKESLIRNISNHGGILITSYGGVNIHQNILLRYDWHYVILDEGHKIRNPDAQITLAVKQFPTPHRVILSGSPLQNNLKELWSLFDFIFPGKLGTLPVFMEQFSVPITLGGYANASTVQIRVAYKCAVVLRDTINPYILRRMKSDVKMNISLPNKNEQVLFCQLTDEQRNAYKEYLNSDELKSIIGNRLQVFVGLVQLRKICNHPDLYNGGPKHFGEVDENSLSEDKRFGYWKRSGKLIVVEAILKMWHTQKHRVLLFSQSRQMLHILEDFVKKREYTYFKMDGSTSIGSRQPLINKFNSDSSIFVFLLTTRVGGLGINLTGADRVIIFDPDWNPSTDLQAKERVWRIGQQKNVTIYRLLTTGTIEEKIYHRQIFKQFLTNRVLKDPRQRRFFKNNELYDLFTLQEQGSEGAESLALFAGTGSEIKAPKMKQKVIAKDKVRKKVESAKKDNFKIAKIEKEICDDIKKNSVETECESVKNDESSDVVLSEAKCEQMRELAKRISQQLGKSLQVNCNGFKLNKEVDKDRNKKKKKKKVKASIFEGEKVNYLVKQEAYRHENDEKEDTSKHDDYVLKKLFSKTGLQSALRHDVIMESPEPDYKIVEAEADRVAKDCIKKVRMSRKFCFPAAEGVPNWTGSQETLPKMPKPRFGQKKNNQFVQNNTNDNSSASTSSASSSICTVPQTSKDKCETITSAESNLSYNMKTKIFVAPQFTSTTVQSTQDLLSKLKERNSLESESDEEDIASISTLPTTEYDELLVDMRNFIAFQSAVNGQASTQEILEQFKNKLPSEKSSVFKALLYQICEFSKDNRVWCLKPDFR